MSVCNTWPTLDPAMFKTIHLLFMTLIIASGCSTSGVNSNGQGLDNVYISGGTEKYFLGNLPHWANFSTWASCQRDEPIRYLNYENIKKSYNLNYESAAHMQHMISRKNSDFVKSSGGTQLPVKDEGFIFNNVYAQVLGGSFDFVAPKFKNISVVWIDPFLKNKKKVKSILNREDVLRGHPVIVSNCLSQSEIETLIEKLDLDELGIKIVSSEMFSAYDSKMEKETDFSVQLDLIMKNKNINLFAPFNPTQIRGSNKFIKIK